MGIISVRVRHIMPQPFKHPKSNVYYYRKVIPEHLRAAMGGRREIRRSLGTKDLREAKRKYPEVASQVDAELAQAAGGPIRLTRQQLTALVGEWYSRQLSAHEADPGYVHRGDPQQESGWTRILDEMRVAEEKGRLDQYIAPDRDALLRSEGLLIDEASRERLTDELFWAKVKLCNTLHRRAAGDYRPDPALENFPKWTRPDAARTQVAETGRETFDAILDAWAAETRPVEKTRYSWGRILKRLAKHVGHDDPGRLTPENIIAWKDEAIRSGTSPRTVKNWLYAAKAVFKWAVKNKRMASNPASGVDVSGKEKPGERKLSYTDQDAKLLLTAARREQGAKQWVPWLLAFSGARLEEVCQSLVPDVREDQGIWYLEVNADDPSKSLKNIGSVRKLPIHPAVITEGFLDYVRSLPKDGPLFPDLKADRFGRRGGNGTKTIGRWVRSLGITDKRKAPNHSWRHRFKDICRAAGIPKEIHDALTGHVSGEVGDRYGSEGYPLTALAEAVNKLRSPVPS